MAEYFLPDSVARAGVGQRMLGTANPIYQGTTASQPKSQNFFGNLASSIGGGVVGAGKFIGKSFIDPVVTSAKAISQGAPIVGSIARNQKNYEQRGNEMDRQLKMAVQAYRSKDPKVKISKEEFTQRIKTIQAATAQLSMENEQHGSELVAPTDAAKALFEAGLTPFAFGKLAKGAGALAKAPGAAKAAGMLEKGASVIPSVRASLEATNKTSGLVKTLAKGSIKYPLVTKPTVDMPFDIKKGVETGDFKSAGINTALALSAIPKGGPVGLAVSGARIVGNAAKKAVYGVDSLFSNIKLKDGSTMLDYVRGLESKATKGNKRAQQELEDLKVYHQYKLDETGGNVKASFEDLQRHYVGDRKLENLSGAELAKDFRKFMQSQKKIDAAAAKGRFKDIQPEGTVARVGRFSAGDKHSLFEGLKDKEGAERYREALRLADESAWGNNPIVREKILQAASSDDWQKSLSKITSTNPAAKRVGGLERGYFPTFVKATKIRANFKNIDEVTESIAARQESKFPTLKKTIEKMGISTNTMDSAVYPKIQADATKRINELDLQFIKDSEGGKAMDTNRAIGPQIVERLSGLAQRKKEIYDLRQLRVREIADELGLSDLEAKRVRQAIDNAHLKVSLGERGLGSRIQDLNIKFNPLARTYSRIQGKFKYQANPFFRLQESLETEILGQGLSGGNTKLVDNILGSKSLQQTIEKMESSGLLKSGGFGSESAGLAGSPFISAKLTGFQKRSLAGMIESVAERNFKGNIDEALKNSAVRDMARSIVQYPTKGFFGSNAARTLNLVTFPLAYNLKIAKIATDVLAKQHPIAQVAIIKGLNDFNDWMGTDEGIKWQAKNSEAIGLLTYFTPVNSIRSITNIFSKDRRLADFGQVGGLPFGLISQIMEDHGVYNSDRPYIDPKTGEVIPEKIPEDLKASAAEVIIATMGSMFNFPGRRVGTNFSKRDLITGVVPGVKGLSQDGTYRKEERTDLSPYQTRYRDLVGSKPKVGKDFSESVKGATPGKLPEIKSTPITPIYKLGKNKKATAAKVKRFARPIPRF